MTRYSSYNRWAALPKNYLTYESNHLVSQIGSSNKTLPSLRPAQKLALSRLQHAPHYLKQPSVCHSHRGISNALLARCRSSCFRRNFERAYLARSSRLSDTTFHLRADEARRPRSNDVSQEPQPKRARSRPWARHVRASPIPGFFRGSIVPPACALLPRTATPRCVPQCGFRENSALVEARPQSSYDVRPAGASPASAKSCRGSCSTKAAVLRRPFVQPTSGFCGFSVLRSGTLLPLCWPLLVRVR